LFRWLNNLFFLTLDLVGIFFQQLGCSLEWLFERIQAVLLLGFIFYLFVVFPLQSCSEPSFKNVPPVLLRKYDQKQEELEGIEQELEEIRRQMREY
jgi:hypothetical protein